MPQPEGTDRIVANVVRNIQEAIESSPYPYIYFAGMAGLAEGTLRNLLSGQSDPRLSTLAALAVALGFSLGELELPRSEFRRILSKRKDARRR